MTANLLHPAIEGKALPRPGFGALRHNDGNTDKEMNE